MKWILLSLTALFFLLPFRGHGESSSVPGYPGWTLERIQAEEEKTDDGTHVYARTGYFSLKPPDKRPAVSINNGVAGKLRGGELGPEAAYNGGNGNIEKANKTDSASNVSSGSSELVWNGSGFESRATGGDAVAIGQGYAANSAGNYVGGGEMPIVSTGASVAPSASSSGKSNATSASTGKPAVQALAEDAPKEVATDNSKKGELTSVYVPHPCAAETIDNCTMPKTGHGVKGGACASGYTGTCSYTCNDIKWTKATNACVLADVTACSGVVECLQKAGAARALDGTSPDRANMNGLAVCQAIGKTQLVSASTTPTPTACGKIYHMALCSGPGACGWVAVGCGGVYPMVSNVVCR